MGKLATRLAKLKEKHAAKKAIIKKAETEAENRREGAETAWQTKERLAKVRKKTFKELLKKRNQYDLTAKEKTAVDEAEATGAKEALATKGAATIKKALEILARHFCEAKWG